MLLNHLWELFDIAPSGDLWLNTSGIDFIGDSNNALFVSEIGLKVAHDQRTRVQTVLVFGALEIGPTKTMDTAVIVPQEVAHDEVAQVSHNDLRPQSTTLGSCRGLSPLAKMRSFKPPSHCF